MKFRIYFSVSQDEQKFRLSFWGWDIWCSDSADFEEEIEDIKKNPSKAGFLSFKKTEEVDDEPEDEGTPYGKLLFQALFYPEVESRIWRVCKKLFGWAVNFFSVKFENIEVKGSLDDPFDDSMAFIMFGNYFSPSWEDSDYWSVKGEMVLKTNIFRLFFFTVGILYELATLAFILWRGVVLAKENPKGENMDKVRRWIFLKCQNS